MKRSEAINRIKDTFGLKLEFAEQILSFVEELGMMPPSLDDNKCQALTKLYLAPNYNVWDEDFEKNTKAVEAYNRRLKVQKVLVDRAKDTFGSLPNVTKQGKGR